MEKQIKELEKQAKKLELGNESRDKLLEKLRDYSQHFLSNLPENQAFKGSTNPVPHEIMDRFNEQPIDFDDILSQFDDHVLSNGINGAHGGHLGYVPGGGLFPSALGDFLAAVTNRYAGVYFASPGAVTMEHGVIDWMGSIFGLPEENRGGTLTSGGSIANLLAVTTARDELSVSSKEYDRLTLYGTWQTHHCVDKAMKIAGLADAKLRRVPMDDEYRMDAQKLDAMITQDKNEGLKPLMVTATAGTTDMGVMDPLDEVSEIARNHDIWYHVDAAYGGFFNLVEDLKAIFKGIEKADSIVVDPHKSLFLPFGTGAFLIRDKQKLFDSQHVIADYMQDTVDARYETSPADLSPELTRHYRGLRVWMPLKLFGLSPFRSGLKEKHLLCRYAWNELNKIKGIETPPEPDLSITFFRYVPQNDDADAFNKALINKIQEDGRIFLSSTRIEGVFHIRIAVLHFRTHKEHIDLTIELIKKYIGELTNS